MRSRVSACASSRILKIVAVGLMAGASAACSDSDRFASNPFSNPFAAAPTAKVDRTTTGSVPSRSAPVGAVTAQPLPSALPGSAAANPLNPAQRAGSLAAQPTPRMASSALQNASPIAGSAQGWTAAGGTPVTVGAGDTASTLSARYGVPVAAINAANGGIIRPGAQAIIPVYSGTASAQPKAGLMQPAVRPAAQSAAIAPPQSVPPAPRAAAVQPPPQRPAAAQPAQQILRQAANPATPARAAAPKAEDDDDEDEKPRRIVAAAPKSQLAPAQPARTTAAASARPAAAPAPAQPRQQQAQAQPQPRPQPRAAAPAPQPEPPKVVAEAPRQADPVTTQSIPAQPKPAEAAADKPDFRWPARGRIISGFGSRGGNGDGIAIAVPEGTAVKAAEGGTVAYAGEELKGYGKLVLIRHDNGYVSAYAHNGELNVKRGDKVARGQTIAKSGATGNVTSPQLHFELRKGSTPVDPTKYLDN